MNIPGFVAEASLYKSSQAYRGYCGATSGDTAFAIVPSQICGTDCYYACAGGFFGCGIACYLSLVLGAVIGPAEIVVFIGCLGLACGSGAALCAAQCPPCSGDGDGGGGGGGPRPCCPASRPFCCGSCVPLPGGGTSCDDACINPHTQHCP
jgi:hypothetical protein